jgi:recombination protein RecR
MDNISSVLLKKCVNELSKLPGVGKKTALRLAIHLLKQKPEYAISLGNSIIDMKQNIRFCRQCHNISEHELCEICNNPRRENALVCVVENIQDVMAIENTMQYNGTYHVLNGVISPMDGISPANLNIASLVDRIEEQLVKEVILALPTTVEGDTTNFYLYKKLSSKVTTISTIARGVSIGDELDYIDEVTLGSSITHRIPYRGD